MAHSEEINCPLSYILMISLEPLLVIFKDQQL